MLRNSMLSTPTIFFWCSSHQMKNSWKHSVSSHVPVEFPGQQSWVPAGIPATVTVLHRSNAAFLWGDAGHRGLLKFNIVTALGGALMFASLCPVVLQRNRKMWISSKAKWVFAGWFKTWPYLPRDAGKGRQLLSGSCPDSSPPTVGTQQLTGFPVTLLWSNMHSR